ncbi:PilW family protein [Paralysiella testudinis]|uniref:Prepilin-type N-terminal cleavage/methylation domain-containing protein n=1 Tax=Paralysiella testudinis TaxID=2809020 RepID=A0A892ZNP7_9NEIS|nr:prepilin-type N-terminal cleavage/methylation domain-containing protein [Paralysiella testudinis]QRQ83306.1 prepilin-type N-terminal cleavage/methylation domain-containing protein [Paralysiella testudinis]
MQNQFHVDAHQLGRQNQAGFSLIEFLVASAISMIVLIAAGSTYFTTQQLNRVATERLNAQQDLRSAANLIVRDARQAGTFGCANLTDTNVAGVSPYAANHPLAIRGAESDNQPNNFGVHVMTGANFVNNSGIANFNPAGNALIFVYGDGFAAVNALTPNTLAASGTINATAIGLNVNENDAVGQVMANANASDVAPLVLSSCNRVQILQRGVGYTRANATNINLNPSVLVSTQSGVVNAFQPGQLGVSKLVGSAYVVGTVNATGAVRGLYRFNLNANGTWSAPQLLVSNVANADGMVMQLGYVQTNNCTHGASSPNEQFQFHSNTARIDKYGKLPALIRIRLNVASGENRASGVNVGDIREYVIDAAVRGGNVCANRSMGSV